jgi:L-ascorbate metabolism protein UlaG (beta-lactamase superfamily)
MKKFSNEIPTPRFASDIKYSRLFTERFKNRSVLTPKEPVASIRTDLHEFYSEEPHIIWFGHSSYLIHSKGVTILVDPVLNAYLEPIPYAIPCFPGSHVYHPEHMPKIDFLVLTHNHYDHFDKRTIRALAPKIQHFITPMNMGRELKGIATHQKLTELNWWEEKKVAPEISFLATPSRHYSGRGLLQNRSHWCSYVVRMHGYQIYIGGDSGYGPHFKKIGNEVGCLDMALLECGQYDTMWPLIHSFPEEVVQETIELNAKHVIPVHWGKFALANHAWNEPIVRFENAAQSAHLNYTVPIIGQPISLSAK